MSQSEQSQSEVARQATAYALARSAKRQAGRARLHEQVLHPIDTPSLLRDPLYHPTSSIDSTIGSVKLLATAVVVHLAIVLVFYAVNELMGEQSSYKPPERIAVQVIEKPPKKKPVEEEKEEEPLIKPDFEPKKVEPPKPEKVEPPKPKKLKPRRKPKPVAETPVEPPKAETEASPTPRRHVGISFESTVPGGKGPAMSTGTSRMGETRRTAPDPQKAKIRPENDAPGTETGEGTRQQRVATHIPTQRAVFVKPKRERPSKPAYPKTLKARGLEGDVKVRVRIESNGTISEVTILESSGEKAFDEEARKAALREKFRPATRDGKAVPYTLSYSYRFRIEEN